MSNKTVIITGAGGFLGNAVLAAFSDLDGYNVHGIKNCDLTIKDNAINALADISEIDVLINIAGGFVWKEISDTTFDDFESQFNTNFKTMYNMTMAALPRIENSPNGHIIKIAAIGAIKADRGMAAYAVSKSAVMRFTEALAIETPDNVTVNAVMPSIIDTPVNRNDMPDADFTKWVTTAELIDQMIFLASNEASAINGELIPVAGRVEV